MSKAALKEYLASLPPEVAVEARKALRQLAFKRDPILFAEHVLLSTPDGPGTLAPAQRAVVGLKEGQRIIVLTFRQFGKTTAGACLMTHHLAYGPPNTTNIIVGPSQRIAMENIRRIRQYLLRAEVKLLSDNAMSLELHNGSRVIALPADPSTVRGLTIGSPDGEPGIALCDESSRTDDELYLSAVRPMLSRYAARNRLVLLSTPAAKQGFFYNAWTSEGDEFIKVRARWEDSPHITPKMIEQERLSLTADQFRTEWLGEFSEGTDTRIFGLDLINSAFGEVAVIPDEVDDDPVVDHQPLPLKGLFGDTGVHF
jgi:hypothetical protein